jgi:lipooligosaccharide transport system ATP-binding protein
LALSFPFKATVTETAPAEVVIAQGLTKRYGDFVAVDGVDFAIPRGQCFGFLGPNGAGKTTTLRLMLGLTPMSAGTLSVLGLPVPERAAGVRARVGVVPQIDNLDPDFTVAENLRVYASYFALPRRETSRRIEELLEFAALRDRGESKTETLSGGMKRRLTIARALINDPELLVLDEPTTGLDPQARHVIWGRLAELRELGTTLVLTTHYMEEAERLCDALVIMDSGRILDQGSPRDLIARHVEPEVIEVRGGAGAALEEIAAHSGCRLERMGNSLYCYTANGAEMLSDLRERHKLTYLHRPADLEDVFLKLTGRELRD